MIMGNKKFNEPRDEIARLKAELEEREQDLERFKVSNLFLEALFDGISEEIMVVDSDGNIRDANRTFLEKYGLEKSKVLGLKCSEIKTRTGGPCILEGEACPLEKAKNSGEMVEMTHSHKNAAGQNTEHALMMHPLRSKGEEIDYFVEIARDVTEYRNLIRKLKASEKRFRAILDTATDGILSIDEDQKVILFNNAAQRIFGYSRNEILGKDLNLLIPPQYGDHYQYVRRFLEKGPSDIMGRTISMTALRRGGEEFPIELSLSFLDMAGDKTFTAIIRDVSGQKKLEKKLLQAARLAAVGHSVAHVSHEIKNPLMIIGGFTSQIKKGLTHEKDIKKIDMVLDEVFRLERMVAELSDFTKEYRLIKRLTDINSVLEDVIKIMAGIYPSERYGFMPLFSDNIHEIECDPDKLKQVFINIISNGFEAMAEGGNITISTEWKAWGMEIKISDDGVGIPDEDLQHIFEPYYTTREKGSGLGLPISYKIIEAHDGELSANSRPGQGTTFIIKLPAT